jgi:hypothetical protein
LKSEAQFKMAWGGARKGAGRKRKASPPPASAATPEPAAPAGTAALPPDLVAALAATHAGKSPEEIMELAMSVLAAVGDFRGAALAAARLAAAKARKAPQSASGKKEAAHAAALDRAHGASPFAVPPPPKNLN